MPGTNRHRHDGAMRAVPALSPAGFWRRYAAWSLDAAIVAIPVVALTWSRTLLALHGVPAAFEALATRMTTLLIDGLDSMQPPVSLALTWMSDHDLRAASDALQSSLGSAVQPALTAFVAVAAAYWIACECSPWQATPGKCALGLVVTDVDSQPISFGRAVFRHVAGALSWLMLNLGHALAAWPPHKRALHDHMAGTRVLQVQENARLPTWARAWLALQALLTITSFAWLLQAMQDALRSAVDIAL